MLNRLKGALLIVCLVWGIAAFAQTSPKTLYFTNTAAGTNIWTMNETQPANSPVSTTIASSLASTTGWYHLDPGLTDSGPDASEPSTTTPGWNTIWVSATTYTGTFSAGNWVFTIRKTDTRANKTGVFHADLYKTTSQTNQASGATFIAHCSDASDDWTGGAATITVTCTTAGTTSFSSNYLAVRTLEQVSASGSQAGTWTLTIQDGTNGYSRLVTPDFTPPSVPYSKSVVESAHFVASATATKPVSVPHDAPVTAACAVSPAAGTCLERTFTFTQPSVHFADVATGVKGSAVVNRNAPGSASCALNPSAAWCLEKTYNFTQPSVHLSDVATGVKGSGSTTKSISVAAGLTLTTNICEERSVTFNPQTMGVTPAANVCLTRNFTPESVTLAANATGVKGVLTKSAPGTASVNVSAAIAMKRAVTRGLTASFQVSPAMTPKRSMHAAITAAVNTVTAAARARAITRPDAASANFATAATGVRGVPKNLAVSENISAAITARINRSRSAAVAETITPAIAIKRGMHANVTSSFTVASNATRQAPTSKSATGAVSFQLANAIGIMRAMHSNDPAAAHLVPAITVARAITRSNVASEHFAPVVAVARKTFRSDSESVHVATAATAMRTGSSGTTAAVHLIPALTTQIDRKRLLLPTIALGPQASVVRSMRASIAVGLGIVANNQELRQIARAEFSGAQIATAVTTQIDRPRTPLVALGVTPNLAVKRNLNAKVTQTVTLGPITFRATPSAKNAIENEHLTIGAIAREQLNAKRGLSQPVSIAATLGVPSGFHLKPRYQGGGTDASSMTLGAVASVRTGLGRQVTQTVSMSANVTVAVNGVAQQRRRGMII